MLNKHSTSGDQSLCLRQIPRWLRRELRVWEGGRALPAPRGGLGGSPVLSPGWGAQPRGARWVWGGHELCLHLLVEGQSPARGSAESSPRHGHRLCPLFLTELGRGDRNPGVPAEPPARVWGEGAGPAPGEGRAGVWHGTVGSRAPIGGSRGGRRG